jgi:hypothetical protein
VRRSRTFNCVVYYASANIYSNGIVVVVIVWQLDLQLHLHSMPITTTVMCSNPAQARCTQCNIMWWSLSVTYSRSVVFFWYSDILVSSTNKTDPHNTTEILLKVALSTINQTNPYNKARNDHSKWKCHL